MRLSSALKGVNGDYEIQRILGAIGTLVYSLSAPALVWFDKVSVSFDTFCLTYPTGLGVCIGSTAGAIALKDRQVAKAKNEEKHDG